MVLANMVHMKKKNRVIVAMSGGVDSSVSAALRKRAGFDVTGMFIKCWSAEDPFGSSGVKQADCSDCEPRDGLNDVPHGTAKPRYTCTATDDERMARLAAGKIGIPFYSVNLINEYKARVVEYLLDGYQQGITPNPDVMCNKEIKFGLFYERAVHLGADFIATGHYARVKDGKIFTGKDKNKDQSYFLSFIKPEVLERVLFPIGDRTKPEVRQLAKEFGLPNADRKDSQGICFIGKVDFTEFLKEYIPSKPGKIVNMNGNILGKHDGAVYYTIGQRKGLGLAGGPYFVIDKNVKKNIVVVSKDESDLLKKEVKIKNLNWFSNLKKDGPIEVQAQIRYRQTPSPSTLHVDSQSNTCTLMFKKPQRAVAPGQLAVIYQGDQMLAGGVIE